MKLRTLLEQKDNVSDQIPYDVYLKMKRLIHRLAMDVNCVFYGDTPPDEQAEYSKQNRDRDELKSLTQHTYSNTLDLIHHVYEELDVERPVPHLRQAWKQYEDLIAYAVQQLQKATEQGIRSDSWFSTTGRLSREITGK